MPHPPTQPDKLVVVVHGVGDPPAGETLSLFARSLAESDQPLEETQHTIWLEEKSRDSDHVKTFPAHRRRIQLNEDRVELVETFWGDLSRVRRGWLGVLQGVFQILFGLRYVAYVAADQPGKAAHWLKTLGLISSRILHGPVAAVTFFLALLIAAVCGTHVVWQDSHKIRVWTTIVILGASAVAMLAANIGDSLTRSRVVERFWFWVNATVMFVVGVMLVRLFWLDSQFPELAHNCEQHPGLLWYCRVLLVLLGMLWFIEIQVLLVMGVCWALALPNKRTYAPALHIGLLLPALAVGIWALAIPVSWVAAKESIGALTHLEEFSGVFDDAIPFLGIQFMMLATILVMTGVVLFRYSRWRSKDPVAKFQQGRRAPRLIVNTAMQSMLGACTALGIGLVSVLWLSNTFGENTVEDHSILDGILRKANGYAIALVVPMGGLLFFVLPHLRPGFDILLDVVNHFYFRPTNVVDALDDDDEFDITETTFENGTLFFSRRDALHGRLKRILSHYRDQYNHQPELVIVAHSQGTMVAIETLNDKDLIWLKNAFSRLTLVTLGSPFHHLYQHYFGLNYPALDQPFWASLRLRLDHWVNVFRVDDYVGTEIEFPESLNELPEPSYTVDSGTQPWTHSLEYENHPVGPRGHQSYWTDREVLEVLLARVFSERIGTVKRRAA